MKKSIANLSWNLFIDCPHYLISEIFDDKFQKNARFMHKPKLTSDDTILKKMVAIRAGSSEKNLVYTLAKNPKYFKNHKLVIKEFEKTSAIPLLGKVDINAKFPWDDCVEYPKDLLLKLFRRI